MATGFTQDAVLHFLQSSGGSVKNSDLLLHFRYSLQDHVDRARNRELFKTFVNSVATVRQVDGVSYVTLRKKFRGGHVPGGAEERLPAEPPRQKATLSPEGSAATPRQKPQPRAVTAAPALQGVSAGTTVLPAAGIVLKDGDNVETHFNMRPQHVMSTPEVYGRLAAAPQVSPVSGKSELKSSRLPPGQDQPIKVGQQRVGSSPPSGITPVLAVVGHGETSQQLPETLGEREACLPREGGLYEARPHVSLNPNITPRHIRLRQSYKSAVSYDEDEDVPMSRGSAGLAPLGDMGRAIVASSPCITDPSVISSSCSSSSYSSSESKLPKIYIQDVEGQTLPPGGSGWSVEFVVALRGQQTEPGPGPAPRESTATRRSLPLEAEVCTPSPDCNIDTDHRCSRPAGVQLEQWADQSQRERLSSSHSCIFSTSSGTGLSSRDSGSPRGSGWNSSYEDIQARTGETAGGSAIQEVLQRAQRTDSVTHCADSKTTASWHRSTGHLHDDQEPTARLPPFHHSTDHLLNYQDSTAHGLPWHLSTGDLCDDRVEAESSEGSTSSPPLRQHPGVARRLSSQLRSRMCRSLGADLDQLLTEEAIEEGGGSEAARMNRLHLISSSLSLRYDLSSSSLSSCSTPPRCHSLADLVKGVEGKGGRSSLPVAASSIAHHEGPGRKSLVPLEPKEHAWLVNAAAGAWPDIYSLFREDSSLLNRRDFISGFTVLHWIAKHGDHRVLNTLWYGVQKAGLTLDINARSTCGHTPLHIAAIHGNKNIMQLLVNKFNADMRLRDTAGKRPWQYLSHTALPDVFYLLGAPSRTAGGGQGGVDPSWKQEQRQPRRHHRRHHLSLASMGERPLTVSGTTKVKRSSSIAAFLKHKSLHRFHGAQSDSSV